MKVQENVEKINITIGLGFWTLGESMEPGDWRIIIGTCDVKCKEINNSRVQKIPMTFILGEFLLQ